MTCGRDRGYTCSDSEKLRPPSCGLHFASLRDFDAHMMIDREGAPHCRPTQALAGAGWRQTNGLWRSPKGQAAAVRRASQRVRISPTSDAGDLPGSGGQSEESERYTQAAGASL